MPSPFPGMDPFLEHPDFFPDLHGRFHVYLSETLQRSLPAPYFAVINERLWVGTSARYIKPDTDVLHGGWTVAESSDTLKPFPKRRQRLLPGRIRKAEPFVDSFIRWGQKGKGAVAQHPVPVIDVRCGGVYHQVRLAGVCQRLAQFCLVQRNRRHVKRLALRKLPARRR